MMKDNHDHSWDLHQSERGNLPESDEAFEKKFVEWHGRDWMTWLSKNLSFPFTVVRKEDDDDAYYQKGAIRAPFRLGHKFEIIGLEAEIDRYGIRGAAREKGKTGSVPLWDVEVTPKSDPNFWPIREYVVWMANHA